MTLKKYQACAIFWLALFLLNPANANTLCDDLLQFPGGLIADIGQKYAVQAKNSSTPLVGHLTAVYRRDGSIVFEFSESGKSARVRLPVDQIFAAKPATSWLPRMSISISDFSWDKLKTAAVTILDHTYFGFTYFHVLLRHQLPMFTHARSDRVRVGSMNPLGKDELHSRIVDELTGFDAHFEALGFRIPEITKIVVQQNTLIPASGSYVVNYPLPTSCRGCLKQMMRLAPVNHDRRWVTDRFVLFHERTHSFLVATYGLDSYLNSDSAINEGLADFITGHYIDSPRPEELPADLLRDIEKPANKGVVLKSILDLNGKAHNDGLFVSNLLWKIRSQIGAAAMDELLPMITDGLNRYQLNKDIFPRTAKNAKVWRVENMISVLRHLAKSSSRKPDIDRALDSYIAGLSLDSVRLGRMAESVVDTNDSGRSTGPTLGGVATGLYISSIGLVIDGHYLIFLISLF